MKKTRLFLPSLIVMNFAMCACDLSEKVIQQIDIEIEEKTRKIGDTFSLNDVTIYANYGSNRKLINPEDFSLLNFESFLDTAQNKRIKLTEDDYVLPEEGEYNVGEGITINLKANSNTKKQRKIQQRVAVWYRQDRPMEHERTQIKTHTNIVN